MAITPSEPDVPLPLTDREQRILDAIGQDLTLESPGLCKQLSALPATQAGRRGGSIDDVICVVVVLVVLGILLPREWFAAAVLIVVMALPAILAALYRPRSDHAGSDGNETNGREPNGDDIR